MSESLRNAVAQNNCLGTDSVAFAWMRQKGLDTLPSRPQTCHEHVSNSTKNHELHGAFSANVRKRYIADGAMGGHDFVQQAIPKLQGKVTDTRAIVAESHLIVRTNDGVSEGRHLIRRRQRPGKMPCSGQRMRVYRSDAVSAFGRIAHQSQMQRTSLAIPTQNMVVVPDASCRTTVEISPAVVNVLYLHTDNHKITERCNTPKQKTLPSPHTHARKHTYMIAFSSSMLGSLHDVMLPTMMLASTSGVSTSCSLVPKFTIGATATPIDGNAIMLRLQAIPHRAIK